MKTVRTRSGLYYLIHFLLACSVPLAHGATSAGSDRLAAPGGVEPTAKVDEDNCLLDLTVRWDVVVGSSAYEIRVGRDCESGEMYNANGSPITVTLPVNDQTLYVRVRAIDQAGTAGMWSNCREFPPSDPCPPGQPGKPIAIF